VGCSSFCLLRSRFPKQNSPGAEFPAMKVTEYVLICLLVYISQLYILQYWLFCWMGLFAMYVMNKEFMWSKADGSWLPQIFSDSTRVFVSSFIYYLIYLLDLGCMPIEKVLTFTIINTNAHFVHVWNTQVVVSRTGPVCVSFHDCVIGTEWHFERNLGGASFVGTSSGRFQ